MSEFAPGQEPQGNPTVVDPQTPPAATPPAGQQVSISVEDYQELMAAAAMAQVLMQQQPAKQQQQAPQQQIDPNEIDRMSNRQLMGLIEQQVVGPLMQTIMNMTVKEEMREVQTKYSDFNDYRQDVLTIAQGNTSLSLEQAYLLAKAGKSSKVPPTPQDSNTPTPKQTPPPAHKTGQPASVTVPSGNLSAADAAKAALAELKYEA
jgi:hypothetical protein